MRIPEQIIDEVRRRCDITEIVGEYVALKSRGNRLWGLSPFTTERTPSFTVTPEKGVYYCFSTNKGGSVFNFIMEMEGLTFPEAVEFLARRVGVEIPRSETDTAESRGRAALLELYRRVAGSFHHILSEHDAASHARSYLEERGFTHTTIERFQLGYSPDDPYWLYRFLKKKKYDDAFLADSGLFTKRDPHRALFAGRLLFPIFSRSGEVIAFGARLLHGTGPKYLNSPNTPIFNKSRNLYGLHQALSTIRKTEEFMVVEGYTDVLALHQAGVTSAVAPLGTALTTEQIAMLSRYAKRAYLVFDSDRAGLDATRKAAALCEAHEVRPMVVPLPEGSDPAELLLSDGGVDRLKNVAENAISTLEYFLKTAQSHSESSDPESAELVLEELFPYIESMKSDVRREASLAFLADELGLNRRAVENDFLARRRSPNPRRREQETKKSRGNPARVEEHSSTAEMYLMLAVAVHRQYFAHVRKLIGASDLRDHSARELFIALEESYRADESDLDALLSRIEDPDLVARVAHQVSSDELNENAPVLIEDTVRRVRRESLLRKRKQLNARLTRSVHSRDTERELLEELMALDGELQKLKVVENDRN